MKNFKFLLILILSICLTACGDDDSPQAQSDSPSVNFDVDTVIALAADTDITNLVTFGGEPAATYTSELDVNGRLTVGRPDGLLPTDIFLYADALILDEEMVEIEFNEITSISDDGNLLLVIPDGEPADYYEAVDGVPSFIIQAIDADATLDIDYKYVVEVTIERGGTVFGPYIIDPKIRIKSRN